MPIGQVSVDLDQCGFVTTDFWSWGMSIPSLRVAPRRDMSKAVNSSECTCFLSYFHDLGLARLTLSLVMLWLDLQHLLPCLGLLASRLGWMGGTLGPSGSTSCLSFAGFSVLITFLPVCLLHLPFSLEVLEALSVCLLALYLHLRQPSGIHGFNDYPKRDTNTFHVFSRVLSFFVAALPFLPCSSLWIQS